MKTIDQLWDHLEQDPDVLALKEKLSLLEAQIKAHTSDEVWQLLLQWEAEWAAYATLCAQRMYEWASQSSALEGQTNTETGE
ncbi:MAG TPA: hypothetical protein VFV52_07650 [Bacilli bacterium]|nr:hypothetical protein [Bacilli bacterium]